MINRLPLSSQFRARYNTASLLVACERAIERHLNSRSIVHSLASIVEVMSTMGVTVEFRQNLEEEGRITFRPSGGASILVRGSWTSARSRFTLAHEIGHWIIRRDLFPQLVAGDETAFRGMKFTSQETRDEELLANLLAAEFLMPQSVVKEELLASRGSLICATKRVRYRCQTSRVATLRRIADVLACNFIVLQVVPRRFGVPASIAEIDDATYFDAGRSTFWAPAETRFIAPVVYSEFANGEAVSIESPRGRLDLTFESEQVSKPILHAVGVAACNSDWQQIPSSEVASMVAQEVGRSGAQQ